MHPYYPQTIALSGETFAENNLAVTTLITAFATGLTVILGSVLVLVRRINTNLHPVDIGLILWFVMCEYFLGHMYKLTGHSGDNTFVLRELLCVQ